MSWITADQLKMKRGIPVSKGMSGRLMLDTGILHVATQWGLTFKLVKVHTPEGSNQSTAWIEVEEHDKHA